MIRLSILERWLTWAAKPFIALLLTGCVSETLYVQNDYLTPERFASVFVDTPDPRRFYPSWGQRLTVYWNLPKETCMDGYSIRLQVRFAFCEEESFVFSLDEPIGYYNYEIVDEAYCEKGGIRSYLAELFKGDEKIDEWRHLLWREKIVFSDEGFEEEEEE